MSETVTIKQLSQELKVSEQALRQWCKKNNVRKERTQGAKPCYIIDFDTEKQIKEYYSGESNETKAESTERKETNQNNESNEIKETTKAADTKPNSEQRTAKQTEKKIQAPKHKRTLAERLRDFFK